MHNHERIKRHNRFLLWRTDFLGIFIFISGIILLLTNFDILPGTFFISKAILLDRIIGILFIVISIGFSFFIGAGGGFFWLTIPAGCFLTLGLDILIVDLNHLFSFYSFIIFCNGLACTFILVFLFQKNHWWALIPAGCLFGLASYLAVSQFNFIIGYHPILILVGLSLSFVFIFLFSYEKEKMKWSLQTGIIIFSASMAYLGGIILFHWNILLPLLIILLGISLLIFVVLIDYGKRKFDAK